VKMNGQTMVSFPSTSDIIYWDEQHQITLIGYFNWISMQEVFYMQLGENSFLIYQVMLLGKSSNRLHADQSRSTCNLDIESVLSTLTIGGNFYEEPQLRLTLFSGFASHQMNLINNW